MHSLRTFLSRDVSPNIREWDKGGGLPQHIYEQMARLGLFGICIPEQLGGAGYDYLTLGIVCEELERVDSSLRVIMSVHVGLNSLGLLQWGSKEQQQRFLIPQASGVRLGAFALSEPDAGSDVSAIRTSARRSNKNYVLNGEKMWISLATKADHFLVFARVSREHEPGKQLSAFVVERTMPGLSAGDIDHKLGVRAGSTGWLHLDDVRVPQSNRLGLEGEGFRIAMSCLDNGRYTVAAGSTGLIKACLEASIDYSRTRETFGKQISSHQLIKKKIADMSKWYEISRLLYHRAGELKNLGTRNTRETSVAKWYATEKAVSAADSAIQIHGAYGYSDEFPVERYFRNARGATIYEGTSEIHSLIQAQYALGERIDKPLRKELPPYVDSVWRGSK
ncbi:MAG: acyl-CoA dehydrogenase family protein [Chloroflexota bacterium]